MPATSNEMRVKPCDPQRPCGGVLLFDSQFATDLGRTTRPVGLYRCLAAGHTHFTDDQGHWSFQLSTFLPPAPEGGDEAPCVTCGMMAWALFDLDGRSRPGRRCSACQRERPRASMTAITCTRCGKTIWREQRQRKRAVCPACYEERHRARSREQYRRRRAMAN